MRIGDGQQVPVHAKLDALLERRVIPPRVVEDAVQDHPDAGPVELLHHSLQRLHRPEAAIDGLFESVSSEKGGDRRVSATMAMREVQLLLLIAD